MREPTWYRCEIAPGVDPTRPGIYAWHIEGRGCYIGRYTRERRPRREYALNVAKLDETRPYRRGNPEGFRRIHRELHEAKRLGRAVALVFLENVDLVDLGARERELIRERGTLNVAGVC